FARRRGGGGHKPARLRARRRRPRRPRRRHSARTQAGSKPSSPLSFCREATVARTVRKSEFIADGITPIAAYARATAAPPGNSFLFESAPGPRQTSRFSIIGLGTLGETRVADGGSAADVFAHIRSMMEAVAPDPSEAGAWGRFLGAYGAAAFEFSGYLE